MGAILTARPCGRAWAAVVSALVVLLAGCGSSGGSATGTDIVATTSILADVAREVAGPAVEITTIIPAGASPHDFQPSARDVAAVRSAGLLVVSGAGFEEGLVDVIREARRDGVQTLDAASVAAAQSGEPPDPHFFSDPTSMVAVVEALTRLVSQLPGVDASEVEARGAAYLARLRSLDDAIAAEVATLPEQRRVLVTNHEVLDAFAARYGFVVVGTVIPGATTTGAAAAGDLARLVEAIRRSGAPAIFVDVAGSAALARTVADEADGVEVVALHTESLAADGGEPSTYLELMRENSRRIVAALS